MSVDHRRRPSQSRRRLFGDDGQFVGDESPGVHEVPGGAVPRHQVRRRGGHLDVRDVDVGVEGDGTGVRRPVDVEIIRCRSGTHSDVGRGEDVGAVNVGFHPQATLGHDEGPGIFGRAVGQVGDARGGRRESTSIRGTADVEKI